MSENHWVHFLRTPHSHWVKFIVAHIYWFSHNRAFMFHRLWSWLVWYRSIITFQSIAFMYELARVYSTEMMALFYYLAAQIDDFVTLISYLKYFEGVYEEFFICFVQILSIELYLLLKIFYWFICLLPVY